ncbi:hypothetical protein EDD86DRAFT_202292 [Gorgonomyces haynaldii]|nr:hypothetical protein EDD86DRAFT_202292 [Gorgonomyces haynaldii]
MIPGITMSSDYTLLWIIVLLFSTAFHELGHMMCCGLYNIPIKSVGIKFWMPSVYVEIDAQVFKRQSQSAKEHIAVMGPVHNMVLALLSVLYLLLQQQILQFGYMEGPLTILKPLDLAGQLTHLNTKPVSHLNEFVTELMKQPVKCMDPLEMDRSCCTREDCAWDIKTFEASKAHGQWMPKHCTTLISLRDQPDCTSDCPFVCMTPKYSQWHLSLTINGNNHSFIASPKSLLNRRILSDSSHHHISCA